VLDGFVIEGNVFEQVPLKAATVKTHVLKRHSLAISVSVLVHVILALLLFFIAEKQQPRQLEITQKAIKSYLYKMPARPVNSVVVKQVPEEIKVKDKNKNKEKEKVKIEKKLEVLEPKKIATEISSTVSLPSKPKASTTAKESMQASFSAYKQLDTLRSSINERMMAKELSELQQFRSPSVMHGEQIPVPHSDIQLTPEQEREKRTTKISNDIAITKYDNGICTIEREQFLGSPVEGSSSAFSCGESKFDKSFREHMKKVRDKLMPLKNK